MVQLCRSIRTDGETCHSPALRHQQHCYFHAPDRRAAGLRRLTTRPGYHWYQLQRRVHLLKQEECSYVLTDIVNALCIGGITHRRARKLLRAINERSRVFNSQNHPAVPDLERNL